MRYDVATDPTLRKSVYLRLSDRELAAVREMAEADGRSLAWTLRILVLDSLGRTKTGRGKKP